MSKTKKTIFWTLGGLVMAGAGIVCKAARRYYDKIADQKLVERQVSTMEGEGGICSD